MERKSVLIVGSGMMGCGIASCALLAGNDTILYDVYAEALGRAVERTKQNIDELAEQELCTQEQADAAMERIHVEPDLEKACASAKVVIEAVFEKLELKQEMFEKLDALLPVEVPILSNTSGLRITDIAARTKRPEGRLPAVCPDDGGRPHGI